MNRTTAIRHIAERLELADDEKFDRANVNASAGVEIKRVERDYLVLAEEMYDETLAQMVRDTACAHVDRVIRGLSAMTPSAAPAPWPPQPMPRS